MWQYNMGFDFFWSVLWFLIILAILSYVFRNWFGGRLHERQTAEDILHERFAKGEINEDEYKKRLETIRNNSK